MVDDDETNFPHSLLLTNRQVENLLKAFANKSSTDIKLSKTKLSKMIKLRGFLGKLLGPFRNAGLPLIKNVIKPLAKSVLILLGLTAPSSAADAGIHKKNLRIWSSAFFFSRSSFSFFCSKSNNTNNIK